MAEKREQEGWVPSACVWREGINARSFGRAGTAETKQQNSKTLSSPGREPGKPLSTACEATHAAAVPANSPWDRTGIQIFVCKRPPARDPPSATSPSPTPEVASLQPQPGFPILPVQAGEGPLLFVKDLPHFLHLLTLHFPEQDIMGRETKGFRGF